MKVLKKNKIILSGVLLLMTIALFCLFESKEKNQGLEKKNLTEEVILEIEKENQENTLIQKKEVEKSFINLVYALKDGNYKSYIVNSENGNILKIEDLVKSEKIVDFQKKVKELIYLKYPTFIADSLIKENVEIAYEIGDKELILHFTNYEITPAVLEELNLKINYNEIKEELNFPVELDGEYENENGYHYDKNKKTIALTFDDGPSGRKTLELLEILKNNKAHATFFMVGNRMESQRETTLEVDKSGNEIGSHSYSHANLTRLSQDKIIEEMTNANNIYKSITGKNMKLMRPPYGNINDLMKNVLDYSFINWNLDTEDWRYRNSDHIYNKVIEKVEDGDIILMHDLYDSTIKAVEKLLPELYVRGYQVVSVTELANLKGVNLESKKVLNSIK